MHVDRCVYLLAAVWACLAAAPVADAKDPVRENSKKRPAKVFMIKPGANAQEDAQTALIKAKPGDTVEFAAGTFDFTGTLSLTVENVTIRGQGVDKTVLSYKKQDNGKEGLHVNRGQFRIENLTIEDTKGDAIKIEGGDGITLRRVKTQWTGGPKETNGAYGIYPVQCKNVLIDECVAIGASDAGIYVGQSQNVIVRKCRAEKNVAGIEIENCIDAEAYENVATGNTGGLLVFDLPGLQQKNGKRVRVYNNEVFSNNLPNFAPKGNMVASVAPGTGMMVMATDQVEFFHNQIKDNRTYGLLIVSFFITGRPIEDKDYDPIPEGVYIHDNKFAGCGQEPAGERGQAMGALLGKPLPTIIYDGIRNPAKMIDGKLPHKLGIYLRNNGDATFANLNWDQMEKEKEIAAKMAKIDRNLQAYEGELPPLPPVHLQVARGARSVRISKD